MPQPRVLVVDDQPSAAYLLATMASACDCDVRIAVEGNEAVEIADHWRLEVVLLDLMMPDMDGFEVAARLRASLTETKIVAVTALPHNDERVQQAAFDRCLSKPVLKETVGQVIRQLATSRASTGLTPRFGSDCLNRSPIPLLGRRQGQCASNSATRSIGLFSSDQRAGTVEGRAQADVA